MKQYPLIILLLFAFSCETGIDVTDDSWPVPIVYCILNQADSIQRLRISRSYLSQNGLIPPASSDSLTIPGKVNAIIEVVENSRITGEFILEPHKIQKDSGFFPNDVNWIYQGVFKIKDNTTYRLTIDIGEWNYVSCSSIVTLDDFDLVDPVYPEVRDIHMLEDHSPVIHWTKSLNAAVYQVGFRVHYKEMEGDRTENKSFAIPFNMIFYRDDPGGFYSYSVNSNQFYKRLSESIPADSALLRIFISTDVFVIAGNESLGVYLTTLASPDPFQVFDYTNLINGHGIFGSCKTREIKGFKLDDQSLDTLAYGRYTRSLNFLDSDGHRKD
ncbi:MAG: hypothetical protein V2A67_01165 [Bacteroidota bacterium]